MGYGILNGCLGVGAVVGAMSLAWIRQRVDADTMLLATGVYYVGDDGGAGVGAAALGGDFGAVGGGVCLDDDDVDAECERAVERAGVGVCAGAGGFT